MELLKAIRGRRSVRVYIDKPVEKEKIMKIIETGMWAPSACNIQGWKFIVIEDEKKRNELIAQTTAYFIKDSPIVILVLYNNRTDNVEYDDHVQSASACMQNMHLSAESLGLGSCWVNNLPPKKVVRKIFNIPESYDPIALFALGYYKNKPKPTKRIYTPDEVVSYNNFNFNIEKSKKLLTRTFARKVYFKLPLFIRKTIEPFARKFEKRFDLENKKKI